MTIKNYEEDIYTELYTSDDSEAFMRKSELSDMFNSDNSEVDDIIDEINESAKSIKLTESNKEQFNLDRYAKLRSAFISSKRSKRRLRRYWHG